MDGQFTCDPDGTAAASECPDGHCRLPDSEPEPDVAGTCAACSADSDLCEEAFLACQANPDCAAYETCADACSEDEYWCRHECQELYPTGLIDGDLLNYCQQERCNEACATGPDLTGCTVCTYEHCADESVACYSDEQCYLEVLCRLGGASEDECAEMYGSPDIDGLITCQFANCSAADACG